MANLVFLTQRINTRASNWDFERKKKEYFASKDGSSPFIITQGVLQAEKWAPEHLRIRQNQLIEKLCEVWKLNVENVEEEQIQLKSSKKHLAVHGYKNHRCQERKL